LYLIVIRVGIELMREGRDFLELEPQNNGGGSKPLAQQRLAIDPHTARAGVDLPCPRGHPRCAGPPHPIGVSNRCHHVLLAFVLQVLLASRLVPRARGHRTPAGLVWRGHLYPSARE